jgi:tetratricopeptide (TPR) repeat protein
MRRKLSLKPNPLPPPRERLLSTLGTSVVLADAGNSFNLDLGAQPKLGLGPWIANTAILGKSYRRIMDLQANRKVQMKQTTCVCVAIVAFGVGTGCIATKQTYLSRGNKFYDAGKYEDASLNYLKAIQKDPKFGEAHYRLGLSAMKLDRAREAYDSLYRATQLLPNRVDVTEKFADICLSYYLVDPSHPKFLYQQITEISDQLLAKDPNSYEGLMLKGYLAQTDRNPKVAIDFFRKAIHVNSSDQGVQAALVKSLLQTGETQEAEKLAMDLINRQKSSYGPIYDLMYGVYASTNRPAEAENVLKAKVANNPKQANWIVQLAHYYRRNQRPAEMKAALQRLLDNPKDFPNNRLWVGDFYVSFRDYAEAIRYYQEGARATSDVKQKSVYQDKVLVALLSQGKNEEGLRLATQILKENPQDDTALGLQADLLLDSGKSQNLDTALHAFQDLSKRNPSDATMHLHLGRAYRKKGDLESAGKEYQQAVRIQPGYVEARYEIGLIDTIRGQSRDALRQANEILAIRPDYRPAMLLRTESLIRTGDLKTARMELSRLEKNSTQDNQVQFQMALIALYEKKYPQALDTLNRLRSTGDAPVFIGLAQIYTSSRQFDKAFDVLNDGLKRSNDTVVIHHQLGITAALAHQFDRSISEFQKALASDPNSVETMRLIADVYALKGDPSDAVDMYRKAYEAAPNNVSSALALAAGLVQAGRTAEARAQYLKIVKAHPDDPVVLNNAAYLLADSGGDLDEALRLAKSALAKSPEQPAYSDTVGYVYLKKGLNDSAIQTFGSLVRKNPHFAAFHYHLGLALYAKGEKAAARLELNTALANHPSRQDEQRINELLKKLG